MSDHKSTALAARSANDFEAEAAAWQLHLVSHEGDRNAWLAAAKALRRSGRSQAGFECLSTALTLFPKDAKVARAAALAAERARDWEAAARYWEIVATDEQYRGDGVTNMAAALRAAGNFGAAASALESANAGNTGSVLIKKSLAELYSDMGRTELSLHHWACAIDLAGSDADLEVGRIDSLMSVQLYEQAVVLITAALEEFPDDVRLHTRALVVGAKAGRWLLVSRSASQLGDRIPPDARRMLIMDALNYGIPNDFRLPPASATDVQGRVDCFGLALAQGALHRAQDALSALAPALTDRITSRLIFEMIDKCSRDLFVVREQNLSFDNLVTTTVNVKRMNDETRRRAGAEDLANSETTVTPHVVYGAYIIPNIAPNGSDIDKTVMTGGVYDGHGLIVESSIEVLGGLTHQPDDPVGVRPSGVHLSGRWLYGGVLRDHVGHFLTESMGRFWAAEQTAGRIDGVVYLPSDFVLRDEAGVLQFRRAERLFDKQSSRPWVRDSARIFAGANRVHCVSEPTTVEELIVAPQLMSLRREHISGHPLYRRAVRTAVDKVTAPKSSARAIKVYASRSKLGLMRGSFFMEDVLEDAFRAEGYTVISPEDLTLVEQFQIYRDATHIVMATGSAAHVAALALDGSQSVALLARAKMDNGRFTEQLLGMGARSAVSVSALDGYFAPNEEARKANRRRFQLHRYVNAVDLADLWFQLKQHGFVTNEPYRPYFDLLQNRKAQLLSALEEAFGTSVKYYTY